jgi:rRNA maturation protein Nop10
MNRTKYLKGECQHCGGHLEFLADHIGMMVSCPHCGQQTELQLPPPPEEPSIPRRALVWTGIAVVVLGLGLVGSLMALKRAQRWAERQKTQAAIATPPEPQVNAPTPSETNSPSGDELKASTVSLEHAPGTSLVYAVGTIRNGSNRQRFGVKVDLELLDATGQKIGNATDYRQIIEPGGEWQFKALVVDSKAKTAKVKSILEDQ